MTLVRFIFAPQPWTTAMSNEFSSPLDLDVFSRRDIAAEAAIEYVPGPSYDDPLRDRRRRAVKGDAFASRRSGLPQFVTIIAILVAVMALIGLREKIVRTAPFVAAVYSAIRLPVNLAGLELRSVKSQIFIEGYHKVLTIEGEIVNLRREANRVPLVALAVRDANGQDKYAWTTPAPKARLEAGEIIAFRARLASPPPDGSDVLVRFASAEETATQTKANSIPSAARW
jgi:hypothetical protein